MTMFTKRKNLGEVDAAPAINKMTKAHKVEKVTKSYNLRLEND